MSPTENKAVFLSYASQDAETAQRIAGALRAAGVEVWFDQNELVGGDAWDAKIRGQIAACALFVPVISASTQARLEGYFRIEWKLAAQRTHAMAEEKAFLLPVVIDATRDAEAKVPAEFRAVQWTRLPGGETPAAFCARVKRLLGGDVAPAFSRPSEIPGKMPAPTRQHASRPWLVLALVGLVALVAALAVWQPWRKTPATAGSESASAARATLSEAQARPAAPAPEPKSVAVLPFANLSGDPAQEYFSDGLTDEILTALSNERDLRVPGRTSAFAFKGGGLAAPDIARALNVAQVVEGSVRKSGDRVRIIVSLTRAADGFSEPLGEFTEKLDDVFALQEKIARAVVQKLTRRTTTAAAGSTMTRVPAAHDAYLRARALSTLITPDRAAEIAHLQEAVRLDPEYALAWARLTQALIRRRAAGMVHRTQANAAEARQAAATALRLNPNLPEAHLAQALLRREVDRDLDGADRELDIVERLRPGDAEAPGIRASIRANRGQWDAEFVSLVWRAVERDPQNHVSHISLASILSMAGRFADAGRLLERVRTSVPGGHGPMLFLAANSVRWTGDPVAAQAVLEAEPGVSPLTLHTVRWPLHAQQGNFAAALADAERALELDPTVDNVRDTLAYRRAVLTARVGLPARARVLFEAALAQEQAAESDGSTARVALPALIKARLGRRAEALAEMEDIMRRYGRVGRLFAHSIAFLHQTKAEIHAVLGQVDEAVAALRAAHEMGFGFGYTLRLDLEWEPLRSDPKFQQLMKEAEARADAQPRPKP